GGWLFGCEPDQSVLLSFASAHFFVPERSLRNEPYRGISERKFQERGSRVLRSDADFRRWGCDLVRDPEAVWGSSSTRRVGTFGTCLGAKYSCVYDCGRSAGRDGDDCLAESAQPRADCAVGLPCSEIYRVVRRRNSAIRADRTRACDLRSGDS